MNKSNTDRHWNDRVIDHQMDMDGFGRQPGDAGDEIGEEQEGRREVAVRDVDVMQIDMRLDPFQVALETAA